MSKSEVVVLQKKVEWLTEEVTKIRQENKEGRKERDALKNELKKTKRT